MVRRAVVPLIGALALPVTLLGAFTAAPSSASGFSAANPPASAHSGNVEVRVEWVLRTRDLVACQTAASDLRRIQRQHGGRVQVVAYPVASDTALVRSFLRRERLANVELRPITEREFQTLARRLGEPARTPTLVVLHREGQLAFDARARAVPGGRGVDDFSAHVASLLNPAGVASDHRSTFIGGQ